MITNKKKNDSRVLTHRSRSWIGHLAGKLRPLILRPLLVQEISLEGPNNVLHAVDAHCRPVENITGVKTGRKTENNHSSQSETFRLLFLWWLELKQKTVVSLDELQKVSKQKIKYEVGVV